ncbi:TonB-dependent receptor domain-containing protein [Lewinella sp. JB7]|uniref:TonB-dependent receptor domain-containing protein n=1 Tax=Lewinella sp. JB7 TaxID=2962887 RepID=UPI0020CA20F9|nr:TonB-dependent receptor [Lewinella sp. JB7]MCP9236707.1 TonB-dependent receptor [Lewinella sp. JB7]
MSAQTVLSGSIFDAQTGDPLIGASVLVKGTTTGTVTEPDGSWTLTVSGLPTILQFSYIGFAPTEVEVTSQDQDLRVRLGDDAITTDVVEVRGRRISEKQQQAALTVETLDAIAIKETAAANFYDGLGSLKDVDLTAASLGFKIVNTRGFNSTNPVRSLQIIDGVDNQSPGLNFSLGNFLGASELDVNRVNLVVGASSAFYGPNAFNGVISIETKDPFLQQGLSVQVKGAERSLFEAGIRWAQALRNDSGREWMAYKVNLFGFRANDWVADNYDPVFGTELGRNNPGGYDAVNRYGDEFNRSFSFPTVNGLGTIRRPGYNEEDLVDYDSENLKASVAVHFRLNPERTLESTELLIGSNYSTGTTVYQGDNRFSLKDIRFFQHKVELRNRDNFFLRAYITHEDAGNSYDPYFTALRLQDLHKTDGRWQSDYRNIWIRDIQPQVNALENFPDCTGCSIPERRQAERDFYASDEVQALLPELHDQARALVAMASSFGTQDRFEPGTARFQAAFDSITTTRLGQGGTQFFDKSALYHVHGEKQFRSVWQPAENSALDLTVGGNFRQYTPNSQGTILLDTMGRNINTSEFGLYGGGTMNLRQVKLSASLRADKNQNFDLLFSPAASVVYSPRPNTTLRASFSSAIRNPTLNDQYLFYNVGRAILLGNIDGVKNLVTVPSFVDVISMSIPDVSQLEYFDVDPIRPEKVRTFELGARSTVGERLYVDATYYYSRYTDFIGFNLGLDVNIFQGSLSDQQAYRVSANATDVVTTQGFSIGSNFYFADYFSVNGNYSWNVLNTQTDDPIIPAFNTPEHKFNIGVSGRDIPFRLFGNPLNGLGANINYKWVDSYLFEGSPQFTGPIESYGMLDAQVNFTVPRIKTTFKLGASNLLDNQVFQVYGGPRIGRLAYVSATYNLVRQ